MSQSIPEHDDGFSSRRRFLKAAGALTLGAAFAGTAEAAAGAEGDAAGRDRQPASHAPKKDAAIMQIGILLGTFSRPTLEAQAGCREVQRPGPACNWAWAAPAWRRCPTRSPRNSPSGFAARSTTAASRWCRWRAPSTCAIPTRSSAGPACGGSKCWRRRAGAGHVDDPPLHRHARPRQHVAPPSGQRFARGLARHGRLHARGGRNRQAGQRGPGLRAGGQQRRRFREEGPAPDGRSRLAAPEGHHRRRQYLPRRRVGPHERDPRPGVRTDRQGHRLGACQGPEPRRRRGPRGGRPGKARLRPLSLAAGRLRVPRARCCCTG